MKLVEEVGRLAVTCAGFRDTKIAVREDGKDNILFIGQVKDIEEDLLHREMTRVSSMKDIIVYDVEMVMSHA